MGKCVLRHQWGGAGGGGELCAKAWHILIHAIKLQVTLFPSL